MRVLHVVDVSLPMMAGYTARTHSIVTAQRSLGLDPVVLSSVRQRNPDGRDRDEIDGILYHRTLLPRPDRRTLPRELYYLRRRIVEVAKQERVDLIHGHSSILCGIPSYLAARKLGIPVVYEIRAFWEDGAVNFGTTRPGSLRYRSTRAAETALARRVDALVGICEGIEGEMLRRGVPRARVHVVPNGVDTDRFVPRSPDAAARQRYGLEGKKVVAYIGTFFPFEGVPLLVEALVRLMKGGRTDIRGLMIGAGETYDQCRAVAARAGLESAILHPGRVPHSEVEAVYSIADVLAYPRESNPVTEMVTPLKPLEAMAMEKAVMGSDVGGLRELIHHNETGVLFRQGDVEELSARILQLVDDDEQRRRLGRAGRAWVVEHRQWPALVRRYVDIYEAAQQHRRR